MRKILSIFILMTISSFSSLKAQSDPYIGQIAIFPYNFAPRGWTLCDGKLLPIAQYSALFSLLGTTYGGNGQTNFAVPDLRGRVVVGIGSGDGLSQKDLGQMGGTENNTLTVSHLPAHNHPIHAVTTDGNSELPTGTLPANTKLLDKEYSNASSNTTMSPNMVGNTGNGVPVNNMQPYTAIGYYIALQGVFPSMN